MHFIFKKECHGVGDVVLFFSANIPRKVVFLKIFLTDFGSHECLVKKILIL